MSPHLHAHLSPNCWNLSTVVYDAIPFVRLFTDLSIRLVVRQSAYPWNEGLGKKSELE